MSSEYDYEDAANMSDSDYEDLVKTILYPNWVEMIFVVLLVGMMITGFLGNMLVVTVVVSKRSMWSTMNIFLTNLAVADLLILTFCLPPTVLNDVTKTFWLSQPFCKSMIFMQNTSVYVSILSLISITFERWRAVTSPLETSKLERFRTRYMVLGTWLLAMLFSSPEPMTLQLERADFARENFSTTWGTQCKETWSPEFQKTYQIIQLVFSYLLPLGVITFMCWQMSVTLKYCQLRQIGPRHMAKRRKANRMLMVVVSVFAVSYFPVHLYNLASAFGWMTPSTEEAEDVNMNMIAIRKLLPRVFSYSSSCLNPILYNFMCSKFRTSFARVVFCRTGRSRETLRRWSVAAAADGKVSPSAMERRR